MANSWALDANWDMFLGTDNKIGRVVGIDEVRQHIRERLLFFFEEWFLDRDAGVPWYQEIFVKPEDKGKVDALLKKEIIETKGVKELLEFSAVFDSNNRKYHVITFTVSTDYGLLTETL